MSADPQVWRQALPVDPSLGEYPEASEVRQALFTRFVPFAGFPDEGEFRSGVPAGCVHLSLRSGWVAWEGQVR